MFGPVRISLLALAIAAVASWAGEPGAAREIQATTTDPLQDTDGDFLPDQVEWAVMTSAASEDTDGDQTADFVEVVQKVAPRQWNASVALDHEMRVVVSSPGPLSVDQTAWLHVLVRFAGSAVPVEQFAIWFETPVLPGLRIPLDGILLAAPSIDTRVTSNDGVWLRVSAPLVSVGMLQSLVPCSIQSEGCLGGRQVHTSVSLFDVQGTISTLVPFSPSPHTPSAFAVHSIGAVSVTGSQSNKVCLIDLAEVGSGPGGTVFEVTHAECVDCNELECGAGCAGTVGWLITVPGGTAALGGY